MGRVEIKNPNLKFMGLSSDYRTNKWEVKCPTCGNWNHPTTTLSTYQSFECEGKNCDEYIWVDYNNEIVKVLKKESQEGIKNESE